jgi:ATP-dependent Clp protease ATP-binding subunit ClpC
MFERFTDKARRVVVQAQHEARQLDHNYIGTEHLLLGLLHEDEGLGQRVLVTLNVDTRALADDVTETVGRGAQPLPEGGHIPFTPSAKKVLELSLREALTLKHNYIGTEHLLLGMLAEGDGVAAQVLTRHGVSSGAVRQQVIELLARREAERHPAAIRTTFPPQQIGQIPDVEFQLAAINRRLTAIENNLGIEPSPAASRLREVITELARVRRDKVTAIDEQDMERAAGLREQEKRLLASRREAELAWLAEDGEEGGTTG